MNSRRLSKNQRISKLRHRKQQHLLEVSVRSDIARTQRNRAIFFFCCKAILLVGTCAGLYVGATEGLRRYFWENPDYFLSDLRVTTDGALTREQIVNAAGLCEGRNIFTVDLAAARTALMALPQVDRVEIERTLPRRVSVNVIERRPVAWVTQRASEDPSTSERAFLIDARGVVMRSKTILPEYLHMPVISGVEVENLAPGQKVRSFEMQAALDLVRLNVDNARFQPRNIDVAKGYCLVVTDQLRRKITFGLDRVDLQLQRLDQYLDYLEPTGRDLRTVNLFVERNTPITFADSAVAEPDGAAPAPAAPARPEEPREKAATGRDKPASAPKRPAATPTPSAARPKETRSTPDKRSPIDGIKKPFRTNGQ